MISTAQKAALGVVAGLIVMPVASVQAKPGRSFILTADRMSQMQQINSHVNSTIREVSDLEQYGRDDVWALPISGKGDCEDFAMLKRKLLIERGWPSSALSITVGATAQGEAHAVLVVSTAQGQYVLDNLTSSILSPERTGHVFHARQSGRAWISASGEKTSEPVADLPVAQIVSRGRRG